MATTGLDLSLLTDVTRTVHRKPYPSISPTRPELSQAGKTVLITGGHTGVGRAIATAFIQASAHTVIIIGRRPEKVAQGAEHLERVAQEARTGTNVIARVGDINNTATVEALWNSFRDQNIHIDVLVNNAAKPATPGKLLELGRDHIWSTFEINVRAPLDLAERFCNQEGKRPKFLLNVSTQAAHYWTLPVAVPLYEYGLTKNAAALLHQLLAHETPAEEVQIINFHPGVIYSEIWANYGVPRESLNFDDENLAGHWAVWAASPEARFLHGRFVWTSWDVEELQNGPLRKRIDEDYYFLRIGVAGLEGGHLV